jgi:hypothetical protein
MVLATRTALGVFHIFRKGLKMKRILAFVLFSVLGVSTIGCESKNSTDYKTETKTTQTRDGKTTETTNTVDTKKTSTPVTPDGSGTTTEQTTETTTKKNK